MKRKRLMTFKEILAAADRLGLRGRCPANLVEAEAARMRDSFHKRVIKPLQRECYGRLATGHNPAARAAANMALEAQLAVTGGRSNWWAGAAEYVEAAREFLDKPMAASRTRPFGIKRVAQHESAHVHAALRTPACRIVKARASDYDGATVIDWPEDHNPRARLYVVAAGLAGEFDHRLSNTEQFRGLFSDENKIRECCRAAGIEMDNASCAHFASDEAFGMFETAVGYLEAEAPLVKAIRDRLIRARGEWVDGSEFYRLRDQFDEDQRIINQK